MLPGVNKKMLSQAKIDPNRMRHLEAIVLSMTPSERRAPGIINGSRRLRIAKGAGRPVSEVNKLLDQFRQMQKMMKQFGAGGGGAGGGGRMGLPPGMMGGLMR
jgi:signal recognition particle subunit SRP54